MPSRPEPPRLDAPAPPVTPSFFTEWVAVRWPAVMLAAALAGLLEGSVRALGVDPSLFVYQVDRFGFMGALELGLPRTSEVPGVLGCVAIAIACYAGLGAVIGLPTSFLLTLLRRFRGRPWISRESASARAAGWTIGLWLAVVVYWWTRPVVYPGLPATDPKRVAAAAGILLGSVLVGHLLVFLLGRRRWIIGSRRSVLLLTLVVIGGALTLFQWSKQGARGAINDRNRDLPNVLLVIVDALRQDTIGAYGHGEVHTPHIDRLANEGVLFENAFAPTPFTWPSFGSILTGKVPRRHGLLRMEPGHRLPPNATLPLLLERGRLADGTQLEPDDWHQGAFMTGTLSHGSGLLDGFDVYLEALVGHDLVDVHSRWSKFRSGLLPWLVRNKLEQKSDRHLVTTTAGAWLERQRDHRFLAMVHLYSTHTPYDPAPAFRERHLDPAYDGPFDSFVAAHREAIEKGEYVPTPADVQQVRRLYLAGVEQADAMIGRLLGKLSFNGVLDDTIVIVTSDHGESLGEHGLWEHNWMYQDNLRVPLVMRYPPGLPGGKRVAGLVDSIDIVPTVLDLMGIEAPTHATEAETLVGDVDEASQTRRRMLWDAIDGRSLVPLAKGLATTVRAQSFSENGLFLSVQDEEWKLIVRRGLVKEGAYEDLVEALERGDDEAERPRLYRVDQDPYELENRFEVGDEAVMAEATRLIGLLRIQVARLPIRDDEVISGGRDVQAERLFQGLGYAGGVGATAEELKDDSGGDGDGD